MNILVFSPVRIYPADAGSRIRILNFIKYLKSQNHQVHYVYYTDDGISKAHFEYMLELCETFTVISRKEKFIRKTGNYKIDEVYEDNIHIKIIELINIFNIETILINYIIYSKIFDFLPKNIYKIIDTHDKFTDRYKLFANKDGVTYDWHSYSKEDEAKALNRADMILAITDEEKKYFSSICEKNKKIITLGHIEHKKYINKKNSTLKKIGFIGGANKVNIIAINKFLEIFYKISSNKNLEIVIAGQICNHIYKNKPNIKLLGLVDQVDEFYEYVDLIINPLTFGTGQKIKSVEALSFAVPIISTKVGFEGIESNCSFHKLDSLEEMIKAIDSIIQNPKKLKELSYASYEIFDNYCYDINYKFNYIFKSDGQADNNCEVLLKYKPQILKETYNTLIDTYLEASKRRNKKIKEQEKEIMQMNIIIERYNPLMNAIKDITKVSFIKHPIKKFKLYKKILRLYYFKE